MNASREVNGTEATIPAIKVDLLAISDITKIKKSNAGTCIIWHDILIDQLRWKTSYGLLRNAEIEFGRMYRHLIQEGNAKIIISSYEEISKGVYKEKSSSEVRKNDPLFLMKNCVFQQELQSQESCLQSQ